MGPRVNHAKLRLADVGKTFGLADGTTTRALEGFSLEVDGKSKSQYPTAEAATKAGAELKRKFPVIQVMIYDAAAKTRTLVEAAE